MVTFKFIYRKNIHEEFYNDKNMIVEDVLTKYSHIVGTNANN